MCSSEHGRNKDFPAFTMKGKYMGCSTFSSFTKQPSAEYSNAPRCALCSPHSSHGNEIILRQYFPPTVV